MSVFILFQSNHLYKKWVPPSSLSSKWRLGSCPRDPPKRVSRARVKPDSPGVQTLTTYSRHCDNTALGRHIFATKSLCAHKETDNMVIPWPKSSTSLQAISTRGVQRLFQPLSDVSDPLGPSPGLSLSDIVYVIRLPSHTTDISTCMYDGGHFFGAGRNFNLPSVVLESHICNKLLSEENSTVAMVTTPSVRLGETFTLWEMDNGVRKTRVKPTVSIDMKQSPLPPLPQQTLAYYSVDQQISRSSSESPPNRVESKSSKMDDSVSSPRDGPSREQLLMVKEHLIETVI
jgi:hypothetical protein